MIVIVKKLNFFSCICTGYNPGFETSHNDGDRGLSNRSQRSGAID